MALRPIGLTQAAQSAVNSYLMKRQMDQEQAATEQNDLIKSLMGTALTGGATSEQMTQLATAAPEKFLGVQNYLTGQQQAQQQSQATAEREQDIDEIQKLLVMDDSGVQNYLQNLAQSEEGSEEAEFMLNLTGDQRRSFLEMKAQELNVEVPGGAVFEQGAGDMSGYVFNKTSGEYSADPKLIAQLQAEAEAKAREEAMLTGKDLAGVNDKVTSLVSGAADIASAAQSLEDLEENATPAAQLAAVFKFMKANDPTSTVREGEQGQVYAAEGAMKGFAAQINQLLGKGGLSEENFKDLVRTAKVMANSAVGSTDQAVSSYLTVLEDSLSSKAMNDLKGRVPKPFELEELEQPVGDDTMSADEIDEFLNEFKK